MRCQARDEEAVAELVRRFQPRALDLASALLAGDRDLAEDAVQEAFLVALENLGDLRDSNAFPGWWRQIVRTQCGRIIRKRREWPLDENTDPPSLSPSPTQDAERMELARIVREALVSLPPNQSRTAQLFYIEERSCDEIAGALRIPTGTVKSRLFDAQRRLRAMLLGHFFDDSRSREKRGKRGFPAIDAGKEKK